MSQSWSLARVLIYVVRATRSASVIRMGCMGLTKDNESRDQLKIFLKALTRGSLIKTKRCRVCRVKTKVLQKEMN